MSPFHYGVLRIRTVMESFSLLSGFRDDDSNRLRHVRSAQFADESLDALVIAAKSGRGYQVLPDGFAITASAERQFDGFPKRLTCSSGKRA